MNPFLDFVKQMEGAVESARSLTASGATSPIESSSKVLLFSPHPDDECIIGLLPLRLMREAGKQIVNIPVTFGSKMERREARNDELREACAYLGFHCHRDREDLENLNADDVQRALETFEPDILFFPHVRDWNARHISTHKLVVEAMSRMDSGWSVLAVETEFWGAMDDPNLTVEGDAESVADLVAATSLHVGEVARNPYHLLLPAWMQDNVRRGAELVGGQGMAAPDFRFATLYRLRKWQNGAFTDVLDSGVHAALGEPLPGGLS